MCVQSDPTKDVVDALKYNADGLIPAIAQDVETKTILMMAWMNKEAVAETLQTGKVCYYARSRQKLWRKGESSGQQQELVEFRTDCDLDTVLVTVKQTGVACHTGRYSCFSWAAKDGKIEVVEEVVTSPEDLYGKK